MQVTEQLARFLAAHRPEDVPERVRHEAKRSLVNFFATALGGCRNEAVEILMACQRHRVVFQHGQPAGDFELLGSLRRFSGFAVQLC